MEKSRERRRLDDEDANCEMHWEVGGVARRWLTGKRRREIMPHVGRGRRSC